MKIPDYRDISPTNGIDLDEKSAADLFFGKTQKEATDLFEQNACLYIDHLRYMGENAFAYYFPAIIPYIKSEKSIGDADIILDIESIISMGIEYKIKSIKLTIKEILYTLDYVITNYNKFDPCPHRFKNLEKRIQILATRVKALE